MQLNGEWAKALEEEFKKPYYKTLYENVNRAYQSSIVYPKAEELYTAFAMTPLSQVKAVIMGQDPYPGAGQAMGMSFSVKPGIKTPRSLQNIYKEIQAEIPNTYIPNNGDLTKWAKQGVLLLNATLTVKAGQPNSHQNFGWQNFTNAVIKAIEQKNEPVVYLLWGRNAREKKSLITNPNHFVLEASHPSPMSADRGFFGCGHFIRTNQILLEHGLTPIDWQIESI